MNIKKLVSRLHWVICLSQFILMLKMNFHVKSVIISYKKHTQKIRHMTYKT